MVLGLVAALATPAMAQQACPMEHAIYGDGELGYELRFRPGEPWELVGMTSLVYELKLPDGRELWGGVSGNMGVSRDIGALFSGCDRPGPDDGNMEEAEIEACQVWSGNIYAIADGQAGPLPFTGEAAPPSLLLADLGRKLRYTVLSSPGEEPWDQFMLTGCAQ
jgi:hypothetical protein